MSYEGSTTIITEVDGYKGHNNRYQYGRDERRTEDIKGLWGDNIIFQRFTIWELEEATDEEIQEDQIQPAPDQYFDPALSEDAVPGPA